ncbi:transmembrane protein 18-like [Pelomyxa schiedti]|nr:transmembrane protein 18-like [Pelomyxa schiedti]
MEYNEAVEDGNKSLVDAVWEFVDAVDWRESWIQLLVVFHVLVLVLVVITRRSTPWQCALFLITCVMAALAQPINALAQEYWEAFTSYNYFDRSGFFISMTFTAPLLICCFICVVSPLSFHPLL